MRRPACTPRPADGHRRGDHCPASGVRQRENARKYRKVIEYGSARRGTVVDIASHVDPVTNWNIPLTQTEKLTMSSRPKNPKYALDKNILVIGGSGSGKTRFFVKPSLIQMHSSYVVTDPKEQLLSKVRTMLLRGSSQAGRKRKTHAGRPQKVHL